MKYLQYFFGLAPIYFLLASCSFYQDIINSQQKRIQILKKQDLKPPKRGLKNTFTQLSSEEFLNRYYLASLPPRKPNNIKILKTKIQAKSSDELCDLDISYPQIQGLNHPHIQTQINQHLKKIFLDPVSDNFLPPFDAEICAKKIKVFLQEWFAEIPDREKRNTFWNVKRGFYAQTDYIITFNSEDILSVQDDGYISQLYPSAHPTKHRANATIDLKTGKIYQWQDLFLENKLADEQFNELNRIIQQVISIINYQLSMTSGSIRRLDCGRSLVFLLKEEA